MIITDCTTQYAGDMLLGQKLIPNDGDSLYACYGGENISTGVTLEMGSRHPYLRLTPSFQIPASARAEVKKVFFTHEDDNFCGLTLDESDGEVVMRHAPHPSDFENIERKLGDCLFFLDQVVYPLVLEVVARCEQQGHEGGNEK